MPEAQRPLPGSMPGRIPEAARPPHDFDPVGLAKSLLRATRVGTLATSTSQRVRFNILSRKTGHRVRYDVVDAETAWSGCEAARSQEGRGGTEGGGVPAELR